MIKLIVSDLDGTLLQKGHYIKPEDIKALKAAAENGLILSFASGRMYPEIRHVIDEIQLDAHAVSQNGAYIHTSAQELIRHDTFETELIRQLAVAADGMPLYTILAGPHSYVITELTEGHRKIEANLLAPMHVIPQAVEQLGSELMCCKISYIGPEPELLKLQQRLLALHGDKIDAYISDVDCLDVMPNQVSKGVGLTALQQYLGVSPDETICIGDSFNDIPMFQVTPNSFAISTSHTDVQAQAAHVVKNVAEAVAWVLERNRSESVLKSGPAV
jgi:Cof subfamily protein (haloacid dehalogenase superfamily)